LAGRGPGEKSWLDIGLPASSNQLFSQSLTASLWQDTKGLISQLFNSNLSMPFGQVREAPSLKTLVVTFHGQGQRTGVIAGDGKLPGMDGIAGTLSANHLPVLELRSGDLIEPITGEAATKAKNTIRDYINNYGFTTIVLAGYSWGGGLAQQLAGWLATKCGGECNRQVELTGVALVDAVHFGSYDPYPETEFPTGARAVSNWYQTPQDQDNPPILLSGAPIDNGPLSRYDGGGYLGFIRQINIDNGNASAHTHSTIDNDVSGQVARLGYPAN